MVIHFQPLPEVSRRARSTLIQALGITDTLRFLNQFRAGSGDYTAERKNLFKGESVKSIAAAIRAARTAAR